MKLGELIDLVFEVLPPTIDLTPEGNFVADDTLHGEEGYFNNSENSLTVKVIDKDTIQIYYVDEDGEECGCYYLGEEVDEHGTVLTEDEYLEVDKLDKYKLIALFSKRFGWIEKFESFKHSI